ncbi:hypothetical protein MRB53_035746 [Persea americana]|uniref:Uncharacterized protein n=1 Tax=Persea americana TaxID=3435 RepID=A0ACC2K5G5_PERAE|nr:hypothetical protein MRB53_035746 [Persea americana]
MSALFNFHSFLTVVLLVICTCTYIKMQFPTILEQRTGFRGFFWKAARIGERLSPWVAMGCNFISSLLRTETATTFTDEIKSISSEMNIVVWNMSNDHQHPSLAETPVGRSGTQRSPYLYGWLLGSNILAITLLCIFALSEKRPCPS